MFNELISHPCGVVPLVPNIFLAQKEIGLNYCLSLNY